MTRRSGKWTSSWWMNAMLAWALIGTRPSVVCAGESEAYTHLTERMDVYFQGQQPRLIESYMTPFPPGPDGTLQRVAFLYDNALAVILFVARGTPEDLRRAGLICDALVWYQAHDAVADGRLRQAYRADQNLGAAARPLLPTQFNHSSTGELAWAALALLTYFERIRDLQTVDPFQDPNARYLQAAVAITNFLVNRARAPGGEGFYLGFREAPNEMTVGVPISRYATLTQQAQQVMIPLSDFVSQGLNLERLRALSLVFGDPQHATGRVTFQSIQLVNSTTGTSLTIDNFADSVAVLNTLGFQVGGIADIFAQPSGRTITWNSADGSIDWWYSLLFDSDRLPLVRLNGADYSHLVLTLSGDVGGEEFTVELQGYPFDQELITAKATEHNLDMYVLFMRLYDLTGDIRWKSSALEARQFLTGTVWDGVEGKYWVGTHADQTLDRTHLVEDVQAWALLALGGVRRQGSALAMVDRILRVDSDGFRGFDFGINIDPGDGPWFSPTPDGVWFEGTAQMACAYQVSRTAGGVDLSDFYLRELDRAQQQAQGTNGRGLVAASHDGVTSGFPFFAYYASPHVGATAWYLAAVRHVNPFWNTSTDAPVPHDLSSPMLSPIGAKAVAENQPLSFAITASDIDGDPLTYTVSALPPGATFDATTRTFSWTPAFTQGGSRYLVTFTVTDSTALSDAETVSITVTDVNQPPRLDPIGAQSVSEGSSLTVILSASDPEGDPLTYSAAPLPTGASFSPLTRTFSWTPGYDQSGAYDVTFAVSDGGAPVQEQVRISVSDAPLSLQGVGANPDPFSPNGDGRRDATTLSGTFAHLVTWQLQFKDAAGTAVRTIGGRGSVVDQRWDGTDDLGARVPDGIYSCVLSGVDDGGSRAAQSSPVGLDTGLPVLSNLTASPSPFRPVLGQSTTVSWTLSEPAVVTLSIYDSAGALVRGLLNNELRTTLTNAVAWDGRNASGVVVPAGTYTYTLWVQDRAENRTAVFPASGTVAVQDNVSPTLVFNASPTAIPPGGSSVLSWTATQATSCTAAINGRPVVNPIPLAAQVSVSPLTTTTYALTCTGAGGSVSQSVTVTILPPTLTFSATPTTIVQGQSTLLSWAATNATSCSATINGRPVVNPLSLSVQASVSPVTTTTYSLTCTGAGGSVTRSLTVTVTPPPPPTLDFSANPTTITPGSTSLLTWTTTEATGCSATVNGRLLTNPIPLGAQVSVSPLTTTIYGLTCTGAGGSVSQSMTVTVQ